MPRSDAFATKLLFICSRNRMRSLTAEKIFSGIPGYKVRSAGTQLAQKRDLGLPASMTNHFGPSAEAVR